VGRTVGNGADDVPIVEEARCPRGRASVRAERSYSGRQTASFALVTSGTAVSPVPSALMT
jgi:hypothetical protein